MSENATPQTTSRTQHLTLDKKRSTVSFTVKKLGVRTIKGRFTAPPSAQLTRHGELLDAAGTVRVTDLSTRSRRRDKHLRSSDFFDAATYPEIAITASDIPLDGMEAQIPVSVTIKGTTRPVEMRVLARKPAGGEAIEVRATGELNRREFGIVPPLPFDRVVVAARIEITIQLFATEPSVAPAPTSNASVFELKGAR